VKVTLRVDLLSFYYPVSEKAGKIVRLADLIAVNKQSPEIQKIVDSIYEKSVKIKYFSKECCPLARMLIIEKINKKQQSKLWQDAQLLDAETLIVDVPSVKSYEFITEIERIPVTLRVAKYLDNNYNFGKTVNKRTSAVVDCCIQHSRTTTSLLSDCGVPTR